MIADLGNLSRRLRLTDGRHVDEHGAAIRGINPNLVEIFRGLLSIVRIRFRGDATYAVRPKVARRRPMNE